MTFNRGDAAALFGVFLYSLYSTLLRKKPAIHQLSFLVTLFAVGAASIAIPYLLEIAHGHYMAARIEVPLAILYVGIFPSLLAYFFFNRSVDLIGVARARSEEHTSELQSLMRISYAVFCLKKKIQHD